MRTPPKFLLVQNAAIAAIEFFGFGSGHSERLPNPSKNERFWRFSEISCADQAAICRSNGNVKFMSWSMSVLLRDHQEMRFRI
ncbi:hypothetical protein LGQ03_14815 [Loktanella sp. TSTF-M6]|uniref:Secreted protein n=1 Tax=Loktanella gaetbuli TaxID=2881335 RepID=A0ABS8BXU2_9RHOB|nr:hypothetical protein [Loktanella gaetbuli]MCB5200514.1 hypothetical protein [Loktanella gaetbuli]